MDVKNIFAGPLKVELNWCESFLLSHFDKAKRLNLTGQECVPKKKTAWL